METGPTHPGGVPTGSPQGAAPGPVGPGAADEAKRAKWRAKAKLAYQRRKAREAGQPLPDPPEAPGPVAGSSGHPVAAPLGASDPGMGPVPWTPDMVRPLFEAVVPQVERLTVDRLVGIAQRIGDQVVLAEVRKEAPWNPVAKATVISEGPAQVAEVMNSIGVDAKHAKLGIVAAAVASIWIGHQTLAAKLEELATKHAPPKPDPAP